MFDNKKGGQGRLYESYENAFSLFLETADERHLGAAVGASTLGDDAVVLGNTFLGVNHFLLSFALNAISNYCH